MVSTLPAPPGQPVTVTFKAIVAILMVVLGGAFAISTKALFHRLDSLEDGQQRLNDKVGENTNQVGQLKVMFGTVSRRLDSIDKKLESRQPRRR